MGEDTCLETTQGPESSFFSVLTWRRKQENMKKLELLRKSKAKTMWTASRMQINEQKPLREKMEELYR